MCNTYFVRFRLTDAEREMTPGDALRASLHGDSVFQRKPLGHLVEPRPVTEGELKYLAHMRDIQNMMRMIIDAYDHISPVVKYLNWSDVPRTLRLLQAAVVALIGAYFAAPYIPWRWVLFAGGEFALVHHHPWLKPTLQALKAHASARPGAYERAQRQHRMKQKILDLLDEDRLPEYVWQRGWKDVELFENQRLQPGFRGGVEEHRWSAAHLTANERRPWTRGSDGWSPPGAAPADTLPVDLVPYELEDGYEWIDGDAWRIDWGGAWSAVGVDDHGYVYTNTSWSQPAPYAYGIDPSAPKRPLRPGEDTSDQDELLDDEALRKNRALTRRRRWLRRAVKVGPTP